MTLTPDLPDYLSRIPAHGVETVLNISWDSYRLLAHTTLCAVKSHGSPVGETKQTHPGTNRSARNRLEG